MTEIVQDKLRFCFVCEEPISEATFGALGNPNGDCCKDVYFFHVACADAISKLKKPEVARI